MITGELTVATLGSLAFVPLLPEPAGGRILHGVCRRIHHVPAAKHGRHEVTHFWRVVDFIDFVLQLAHFGSFNVIHEGPRTRRRSVFIGLCHDVELLVAWNLAGDATAIVDVPPCSGGQRTGRAQLSTTPHRKVWWLNH